MADELIGCPLCGFEFAPQDTLCHHGCPLAPACHLLCCPACGYEFLREPQGTSWLQRLRGRGAAEPQCLAETTRPAAELEPGQVASVVRVGATRGGRVRSLTVFGLAPGAEIEIIQQRPACVLRVGETELALDPEIAHEILVKPRNGGG